MKDFISIGKINNTSGDPFKSREQYINNNSEIKYSDVTTALDDFLNNRNIEPINYSITPIGNRETLESNLNSVNILRNANNYIAFDIETIGSIKDPTTFGITELSVVENNNGIIKDLFNLNMGVDSKRAYDIQSLGISYLNGSTDLTQGQKESAYVTAKRIKYNLKDNSNPEVSINNLVKSITDLNNKTDGNGNKILPFNSKRMQPTIQSVWNTFNNAIENNIPIVGHNIKNADIPWINWLFEQQGLPAINFNKGTLVDTFELINTGINGELFDMYSNSGMNVRGMKKLENISTLLGIEQDAHIASSDIRANIEMLNKNINGTSLLDIINNNINKSLNGININNDSNIALLSKKAIPNMKVSLDTSINGFGSPAPYMNYLTTNGVFYNINGISYTPLEKLTKDTRKLVGKGDGLYTLDISQYGIGDESRTLISRGSMQEITDIIGNYFDVYNIGNVDGNIGLNTVSENFATRQTIINTKDYARRKFAQMFEGDTNTGYWYAKKMYESYNYAFEQMGKNLTKENLPTLLTKKGLFPGLTSQQQYRDFYNMFNSIADTTNTVTPILNEIESRITYETANIPSVDDIIKTVMKSDDTIDYDNAKKIAFDRRKNILSEKRNVALKNYWTAINDYINDNTTFTPSLNMNTVNDSLGYINNASVFVNGEYTNINIIDRDNISNNLRKIIYKSNNFEGSNYNNYNLKKVVINDMVKDLRDRGILNIKDAENLINSKDVYNSIDKISDILYNTRQNKILEYGGIENYIANISNDTTRLNLKDIKEFGDGYKVGLDSLDDFLKTNLESIISNVQGINNPNAGEFYSTLIDTSISNANNTFSIFTSGANKKIGNVLTQDYKDVKNSITNLLSEELNYTPLEISSITDRIIGYNSSYINRGYEVQIAKYTNNLNEQQYGIIAYKPEFANSVNRELILGKEPTKALIQPLPKKNVYLNGNIETIKTGDVNVLNTIKLNSFIDKNGSVKFNFEDTITESIRKGTMVYNIVDELYDIGNYEKAKNTILREYRKPIAESPGASNFQTIIEDGNMKKGYIPSLADTQRIVDIGSITTLLGDMYTKDEEYKTLVDSVLGKEEAYKVHNYINTNTEKGIVTDFKMLMSYNPAFGEYIATNAIRGDDIIGRILVNNKLPEQVSFNLKQIHDMKASQILMPSKYKSLEFSITNPENLVTYGHLNPLRRPQINQDSAAIPMFNNELKENALKYGIEDLSEYVGKFKNGSVGMQFNDIVRTTMAHGLYYSNATEFASNGGINNGIYAGMKQISTKDLEKQLNDFDVQSFVKEYNLTHENKTTVENINDLLHQYKSLGLTNEQHSYISPVVDKLYGFKDELKRTNIDIELLDNFNEGDIIDSNTVIGTRVIGGKTKNVYYDGAEGRITFIDEATGKTYVNLTNPAFEQKKYILGGAEKTVGTSVWHLSTGEEVYDEGVSLFGKLFGEGTGVAGYYEFGKHESGSAIIGSPLNIITATMKDLTDDAREKFVSLYNKNMVGYNGKFVSDELNGNKVVFRIDVPMKQSNDIQNIKNLIGDIRNQITNGATEEIRTAASNMINTIGYYNKNNMLYLQIKRSTLNEMMASSDALGGKGIAVSTRTEQVLGSTFLPNTMSLDKNNRMINLAEPIKNYHLQQIQDSITYKNASRDLFNIIEANRLERGLSPINPNGIREVNLSDIGLPKGDILTADVLADTVFSNYDGYSVLKVNLGDTYVTNPYIKNTIDKKYGNFYNINPKKTQAIMKNARQNYLYIPITSPLMISDNELFYSDTLNKSSDLIKILQRKDEIDIYEEYGTIDNLNKVIDKKVEELYGTLDKELNSKNGLMEKSMLSGRMKFSGITLNTGVIQYNFLDETKTKIQNIHSDDLISLADGKPIYNDISYISKGMFESLGIDNDVFATNILSNGKELDRIKANLIDKGALDNKGNLSFLSKEEYLKTITPYGEIETAPTGRTSITYKEFMNSEEFIKYPEKPLRKNFDNKLEYITQKEIWSDTIEQTNELNRKRFGELKSEAMRNANLHDEWYSRKILYDTTKYQEYKDIRIKKINKIITDTYLEKVGIPGLVLRHPAFHSGSFNAVTYKLNPDMVGKSILLTEHIANRLNADTDGDNIMVELLVKEKDGHAVIMEENNKIIQSHKSLLEMQQQLNNEFYSAKQLNEDTGLKFDITLKGFEENLKKIHGENALENVNTFLDDTAYSVGIKARVDKKFIGYISNINKSLRDALLKESEYRLNNGIDDFTDLKSIADFTTIAEQKIIDVKHDSAGKLTTAGMYSDALSEMINSNGDTEKYNKAFNKLYKATTNSAMFDGEVLPSVEDIINGNYEENKNAESLKNIYNFLKEDRNVKALRDPLNSTGYKNSIQTSIDILDTLEGDSSSYIGSQKKNIVNDLFYYTPTDDIYYRSNIKGENDVIKLNNIEKTDVGYRAKIYDTINDKTSYIYNKDYNNILNDIKEQYEVNISNDKEFVNKVINEYKDNFINNELLDPSKTDVVIGTAEYLKNNSIDDINRTAIDRIIKENNLNTTVRDISNNIHGINENNIDYYKAVKGLTKEEKGILIDAAEVFNNMEQQKLANHELAKSGMRRINENIIKRGRKAKIANAQKRAEFKNTIQDIANETMRKSYSLNTIKSNINNGTIYDIDSINNELKDIDKDVLNKFSKEILRENYATYYSNTTEFYKAYNTPGGIKEVLNWSDDLGKGKVGFGKYANLTLDELSISDLNDILSDKGYNEYSDMINASKQRINKYLNTVNNTRGQILQDRLNLETNTKKISKEINITSLRNELNSEVINRAKQSKATRDANKKALGNITKETTKKLTNDISETLKDSHKLFENKYLVGASIVAGVLGLATAIGYGKQIMDEQAINVANAKRNEEQYKNVSDDVKELVQEAPNTETTGRTILDGIVMRIKGKNTKNVNTNDILDSIGSSISANTNTNVNVNYNQKDDRDDIDDSWLKSKIKKLF